MLALSDLPIYVAAAQLAPLADAGIAGAVDGGQESMTAEGGRMNRDARLFAALRSLGQIFFEWAIFDFAGTQALEPFQIAGVFRSFQELFVFFNGHDDRNGFAVASDNLRRGLHYLARTSRHDAIASLMFAIASSRVRPWLTQPGIAGHSTTHIPSSSRSITVGNFISDDRNA